MRFVSVGGEGVEVDGKIDEEEMKEKAFLFVNTLAQMPLREDSPGELDALIRGARRVIGEE